MGLRVITHPSVEPISLADVKADLRIEHTDDDAKLERYITAARMWLEARIQSKIAEQELEFTFDSFPAAEIKLPVGPAQSVTEVNYDNTSGLVTIISAADYWLDGVSYDSWVFPTTSWPTDLLDAVNAVRVRYVAGYPDEFPEDTPAELKQAIRLKVQELYDGDDNARVISDLITNSLRIAV